MDASDRAIRRVKYNWDKMQEELQAALSIAEKTERKEQTREVWFRGLVRAKETWLDFQDEIFLSVNAGIPHTRPALEKRDKVLELGSELRACIDEKIMLSTLATTYKRKMRMYLDALEECIGVVHSDKTTMERLLARLLQTICAFKFGIIDKQRATRLDDIEL